MDPPRGSNRPPPTVRARAPVATPPTFRRSMSTSVLVGGLSRVLGLLPGLQSMSGTKFLYRRCSSAAGCAPGPVEEIKGVIFDMDGTLTIPVLNFVLMRSRLGLEAGQDILSSVQKLAPVERARAMEIIEECEEEGVKQLQLQPGVLDLLGFVAEAGVQRALATRNGNRGTEAFLQKLKEELRSCRERHPHLQPDSIFSQILTRDFVPCKPDPAPALHICKQWALDPKNVAIVGDDKVDLICGQRAGLGVSFLLKNVRNQGHEVFSDFSVDSLVDIPPLLSSIITVTRD